MAVILDGETLEEISATARRNREYMRQSFEAALQHLPDITPDQKRELWKEQLANWRIARAKAFRVARGEGSDRPMFPTGKEYLHGTPEDRERIRRHGMRLFNEQTDPLQDKRQQATPPQIRGCQSLRRFLVASGQVEDRRAWGGAFSPELKLPAPRPAKEAHAAQRLSFKHVSAPAPSMLPIQALHRHKDGFISFAVNRGAGKWDQVISIRADALDTYFPQFTAQLMRDSLVSINASFCAFGQSPEWPYGRPLHKLATLRYLNAVYADLDCYSVGLQRHEVLGEIARLEAEGVIPSASLTVDTGHGIWLLWMLHDPTEQDHSHKTARADDLALYAKVNLALHKRLSHLGSDSVPSAATHVRMDGSFREDHQCYVRWDAHGSAGKAFSYELKDLADFLDVHLRPRLPEEVKAIRQVAGPSKERSRGQIQTNQNRLTAITTLLDARAGGFSQGCRSRGAFFYALALKGVRVPREEAERAVAAMGRECRPELSERECRGAVKEAYKRAPGGEPRSVKLAYQRLANDLNITPQEAQTISQALGGKDFPAAARFGLTTKITTPTGELTKEERMGQRRAAIMALRAEQANRYPGNQAPAYRVMATLLLEFYGITASWITVRTDYQVLGLETERKGQMLAASAGRRQMETQGRLLSAAA